ncbi:MAG: hypothetical protein ACQETV_09440 [Actinomycetota bacterium]
MRKSGSLRWLVVALAVWQIAAAGLSQSGLLPGDDVGTISDRYDSWIDPAGYAFSIWGLVYLASLVLAGYQARASQRDDPALAGLRIPLAVAFALNGLWIIAFQQEAFVLAQAIIVGLTAALAVGYAGLARRGRPGSRSERWVVLTTVGLYLGWATIATAAGFSTTLLAEGVTDLVLPTQVWALLAVVAAGAIATAVTAAGPPEPGFPVAATWALVAIRVEQVPDRPVIGAVAAVATTAVLVALAWREYLWNRGGGAVAAAHGGQTARR